MLMVVVVVKKMMRKTSFDRRHLNYVAVKARPQIQS